MTSETVRAYRETTTSTCAGRSWPPQQLARDGRRRKDPAVPSAGAGVIGLVGDAALAYAERQRRVTQALDLQDVKDRHGPRDIFGQTRSLRTECPTLGVPAYRLEILLCNALVRYEFIPKGIEVMESARSDNTRAERYLQFIDGVLNRANVTAEKRAILFGIIDPNMVPDEVFIALGVMVGYFKNAAAAEKKLRTELGLPLNRLRAAQTIQKRAAIGYFSDEMMQQFSDGQPHDRLVADLVNAVLGTNVTYIQVQHYRAAYRQLHKL